MYTRTYRAMVHKARVVLRSRHSSLARVIILGSLICCVLFAFLTAIRGNISFHTDIARDFLLIHDIVANRNLTLLGPRAGGIPGVFHGPLWLYVNTPFYLLGDGDPSVMGIGWFLLWVASLAGIGYATWRISHKTNVVFAVMAWYAILTFSSATSFINPSGAYMVVPLWFMSVVLYHRHTKALYMVFAFFVLGVIIQFQMALGIPLFVLTLMVLLWHIYRHKRWIHILCPLGVTPFLLSFLVFELRNNFLQTHSVIRYIRGDIDHGQSTAPLILLIRDRLQSSGSELARMLSRALFGYSLVLVLIGYVIGIQMSYQLKHKRAWSILAPDYVWYAMFFWFGYWIITLPYKGVMWGYYFGPLLPMIVIGFVGYVTYVFRSHGIVVIAGCILLMFPYGWISSLAKSPDVASMHMGDWIYVKQKLEETIFAPQAPKDFGYYVFTRDQLGYSQTYAIQYLSHKHNDYQAHALAKRAVTYLLVETEPHHIANSDYWRSKQVGINRPPDAVYLIDKYFQIERYDLTSDEINIPSDPNLYQNLIFR